MSMRKLLPAIITFVLYLLLIPAVLFISAGTLRWPMAWVATILLLASAIGSRLILWRQSPDTLRERVQFATAENTQPWDRALVPISVFLGPIATVIVAGLDHRYGWSGGVPLVVQIVAVLAVAAGHGLGIWALLANPFFSAVARIQRDRGHTVATAGPYRLVRHPGYAGSVLASLAIPFMLNTLWALLPALITVAAVAVRTALEDRMLREELEGYRDYAQQTPYRLIPGVW